MPELVAGSESHDKVPSQPLIKSVYYAHAMWLYGHRAEHEELCVIRRGFRRGKIVNPADYSGHPEKLADTVDFCLRLVEDSDAVVFSRLLGKVTAGVGKEVNHALRLGKPVFELVARKLVRRTRQVKYITRRATVALYRKWRYRNGWRL